jgi:putative spermidine/putrescine transport system substrate-binding protein
MFLIAAGLASAGDNAICYNCPPMWADWASQLEAIKDNLDITVPHDNKNSGQTLSQLIAEKDNPVADVAYYGVSFGIKAKEAAWLLNTSRPTGMKSQLV